MKVLVLNGSPKGDLSVTMQYVKFIEKKITSHEFEFLNIAQNIAMIEKDASLFSEIIQKVRDCDIVLWATPLYVCLVPSQYKRFIELIWERGVTGAFASKYAAVITTSIHFFDNTAHNYLRGICEDLNMNFAGSFSPDMYDIMKEEGRDKLIAFGKKIFHIAENKMATSKAFAKLSYETKEYIPSALVTKKNFGNKNILLLTDRVYNEGNLSKMINRFVANIDGNLKLLSLSDIDIKGGCLGCCQCGFDYRCVYTGKDGFIDFYNENLRKADIIIFAGEIKDRYLSAKWKQMFDRAFFNTHTPTLQGRQFGVLLSGPFSMIPNLREILLAYFQWQGANLVDIVSDEYDSEVIDSLIDNLAENLLWSSSLGYVEPPTFLGVGGRKIFRDDIWGRLRFVFQADHKYYEENGFYDFPQDDQKTIDINKKMIELTSNPDMRENIRRMIKTEMVKPMKHIVETK